MTAKRATHLAKWCIDRLAALVLLLLTAPGTAVIVVAILIEDGRPVLFVQRRAGRERPSASRC